MPNSPTVAQPLREDLVLTLTVQITPGEGQSLDDARQEMAHLLRDYFTNSEYPLLADYSHDAWGGYTGPFIESLRLESNHGDNPKSVVLGEYRPKA